jgi:hypothetical protein
LPSSRLTLTRLRESLARPTDALPLDIFRVLAGALVFAYFLRTFIEAGDFSSTDGLIDHALSRDIFWFTRLGLFQSGMSLAAFQTIFLIACLCSWALILGYRVKLFAALLYVIAVSTYRWNFLVMYVDDAIIHLTLFWLLLLPVGRTLILGEWLKERGGAWRRWKRETVPGAATRCFLWNLALIYLVAGLWKWTSPMWREGTALYAVFKMPISYAPDFWGPEHFYLIKVLNYCALVLEPLIPLIFILPNGHRAKYWLLLGLLGFHLGAVATLRIPFANLACLAAMIIPFGGELMDRLRKKERLAPQRPPPSQTSRDPSRIGLSGALALVFVTVLTLAMLTSVVLPRWRAPSRRSSILASMGGRAPGVHLADETSDACCDESAQEAVEGLGPVQKAFFSFLWSVGIAQQYQLFNWIDERNYSVRYEAAEYEGDKETRTLDADTIFLPSTRGSILQCYLHGVTWMQVPRRRQTELRRSLFTRQARKVCQRLQPRGDVAVYATLERIVPGNNPGAESRALLMRFSCQDGQARMQAMNLDP